MDVIVQTFVDLSDSTYWPLVIDVHTYCLIEDNCIKALFMN
jgi:hypothetical protein